MKRLIVGTLSALTALTVLAVSRYDRNLGLLWDANPAADNVSYYKLYLGTNSRNYSLIYTSVAPNLVLTTNQFYQGKTNFFAVSAVNVLGLESDPSDEISELILTPPSKPLNLRKQ
jgi:fibronectin type 3 domain-containing protein